MDKINEQLYRANIDLVDRNKLLEEDKKILMKRINNVTEYIETLNEYRINKKAKKNILEMLQGRYLKNE